MDLLSYPPLSASAFELHCGDHEVAGAPATPFASTPWQAAYDYGTVYYSKAGRAEERMHLHHHMLGVELTPGIVRTRLNSSRWTSEIMLSGGLYFVGSGSTIDVKKEQPIDFVLATVDPDAVARILWEIGVAAPVPNLAFNLVDSSVDSAARRLRQIFLNQDSDIGGLASEFVRLALKRVICGFHQTQTRRRYQLSSRQIRAALEFINDNLASTLSIERLAQETTGLSGFYFAHAFTAMLGYSPHQYILDRRLSRAHELIIGSHASLAEISYSVGFSSQSHMTSTFCRRFGVSPGRLRRMGV